MMQDISCIGCGLCYQECHVQMDAIVMTPEGITVDLSRCNHCGHCVAVCPTGAMLHPRLGKAEEEKGLTLSPEETLRVLRTPRSIRHYHNRLVPRDVMETLLEAGRYPQTAKNTQGIEYLVVQGREKMSQLHRLYAQCTAAMSATHPLYPILNRPLEREKNSDGDFLFYDCPQIVVAIGEKGSPYGYRNAQFSLTFLSLMAPSLGLGTCWCGQLERLARSDEGTAPITTFLELDEDKEVFGCMLVGYPKVSFQRLVERNPLQVHWRTSEENQ